MSRVYLNDPDGLQVRRLVGSGWSDVGFGDRSEQVRPILEHDVCCDGAQVLEEAVGGGFCDDRCPPGRDGKGGEGVIPAAPAFDSWEIPKVFWM